MVINEQITIDLTPEAVEDIICEYLKQKGYFVKTLTFNVKHKKWTEGYGTMEIDHEKTFLDGVRVIAEKR